MNTFLTDQHGRMSEHCRSRAHCRICRDVESGDAFRRSIAAACEDVDGPEFECPWGVKWGEGDSFSYIGGPAPVQIPPELRDLDFFALEGRINLLADRHARLRGLGLAAEQRRIIESADCTACARNAATARLRVFLAS